MCVVIAGDHGRVALMSSRLLIARGERVAGLVRRPEQAAALRAAGVRPLLADLATATADDLARHLGGARAALFAAGAGLGDAPGHANPVDHDAIVTFADAAERAGVRRFVMLSTMGADPAIHYPDNPLVESFLRARGRADENLLARDALDTTVVRPSWCRDRPGGGRVHLAAVLAALVALPATAPRVLRLTTGPTPVADAVAACLPPLHEHGKVG
ncbi:NAD-dependent epimerase/dehydratase, partial [Streptomyces sp. SPB78]